MIQIKPAVDITLAVKVSWYFRLLPLELRVVLQRNRVQPLRMFLTQDLRCMLAGRIQVMSFVLEF